MDFQKAKIYLDKLNREFTRMSKDPENTIRIDVDIMASYVRELYDAIHSDSTAYTEQKPVHAPVRHPHRSPVAEPVHEIAPAPPPPPTVAEVPPPAPPPPAREEPPAPASPPTPPPVHHAPKHPAASPHVPSATGLEILFEEKQAKELADKLALTPIADLRKAIPLNDRLLYTSELFAGDGKAFEDMLAEVNNFANFEEAREYITHNCAIYYTWTDKKRLDTAKSFVKLVRRRYK
ncbi:MAG: hypothetical protein ACKVT2_03335 [Saprospiraceae bacterium]